MATIKTQLQIKRNTSNSDKLKDTVLRKGEPFYNSPTGDLYIGDGSTPLSGMMPINVTQLVAEHKYVNGAHEFTIDAPIGDKKQFYIISYLTENYANTSNSVRIKVKNIVDDSSYITYTGTLKSLYFNELDSLAFVKATVNMFLVILSGSTVEVFVNNVMDNTTTVLIPPYIAQEGNQIVWTAVPDATSYDVYDNGGITNTTGTTYTFNPNANHELKVKANAPGYNSDWSNAIIYTPSTTTSTILWDDNICVEVIDSDDSPNWSVIGLELYFNFTSNNANFIGIYATEEEICYIQPNHRYLTVWEGSGESRHWNYISSAYKTITLTQDPYKVFTGEWAYFLRDNSGYDAGHFVTLTDIHTECAETDPTSPSIYIKLNSLPVTSSDYDYVLSADEEGEYTGTLTRYATFAATSLYFWAANNDYSSHTEILVNGETLIDFNQGSCQYSQLYSLSVTEDLSLQLSIDYQEP